MWVLDRDLMRNLGYTAARADHLKAIKLAGFRGTQFERIEIPGPSVLATATSSAYIWPKGGDHV
jgi:hypothetical protein